MMKTNSFLVTIISSIALTSTSQPGELAKIDLTLTKVFDAPSSITDVQAPPDGTNRLFLLTIEGEIFIGDLETGELSEAPFMAIPDVSRDRIEHGAYAFAFHPDFEANGFFYVHYATRNADSLRNRLSRFTSVSEDEGDPESEVVLLDEFHFSDIHFGGQICFGPEGYLYVAWGDDDGLAGSAQSLLTLNGKILRLNIDVMDEPSPYASPMDNPNLVLGAGLPEVYMVGLRNPWKMSFDRETGDLYIADVGENSWEEINRIPAETPPSARPNFGWDFFEANEVFDDEATEPDSHCPPVFAYGREKGRSITGGYVYRGDRFSQMNGVYFYSDWVSSRLFGLQSQERGWISRELGDLSEFGSVLTFGESRDGELFVAANNAVFAIGDRGSIVVKDSGLDGEGRFYLNVAAPNGMRIQLQRNESLRGQWLDVGDPENVDAELETLLDESPVVPQENSDGYFRVIEVP